MMSSQHRKYLFQNISHGGSRDALVHLLPMKPSAKEFQDSAIREPRSGVRMFVAGNDIFWEKSPCSICRTGFSITFSGKGSPAPSVILRSELQFLAARA